LEEPIRFNSHIDLKSDALGGALAVTVEERNVGPALVHGCLGGIAAGLVLGITAIVSTVALGGSASTPFRFVAAFAVGPKAFASDFPVAAAVLLGATVHVGLSALYGVVFVSLLTLTFQLSARAWLLVVYGSLFAFSIWEVNFLAVVPILFPYLADRLDLATQLWSGIVSYCFAYGPALGTYVAVTRPGVVGDWRRSVGAPAGTYGRVTERSKER
jgi:hypothetical protein